MIGFSIDDLNELIRGELEPVEFAIGNVKLATNYLEIPKDEIVEIGLFDKETGKYLDNGSDFTFNERLGMLKMNNAYIHLAGGLSCRITNEKITQLRIAKKYIGHLTILTKDEIESFNGEAEKELIEDTTWGLDYSIDCYISIYKNSKLYFYFEPEKLTLREIRIGDVNEEFYTKQ